MYIRTYRAINFPKENNALRRITLLAVNAIPWVGAGA